MESERYWRNTARDVRCFGVDARVVYTFLLALFHLRIWTCVLALCSLILFWIMERFGLSSGVALRSLYLWCVTGAFRWRYIGNHQYLNDRYD